MKLGTIISRAASAYPEAYVLNYFDLQRDCAVTSKTGGDGLAEFVAWELYETYDPDSDDEQQIRMAIDKMRTAEQDLHAVVTALENLEREGCVKAA